MIKQKQNCMVMSLGLQEVLPPQRDPEIVSAAKRIKVHGFNIAM